jgi:hypothetical protein
MTMLITAETADYDGSINPITAAGPVLFTLSGELTGRKKLPTLRIFSRSETAPFVGDPNVKGFQRLKVNFAAGDEYYAQVDTEGNTVSLSAVDA